MNLTKTEQELIHYLEICDDIREHIPFDKRHIYIKYFNKFHELHEAHRKFLLMSKWKQKSYRLYYKIRGYFP